MHPTPERTSERGVVELYLEFTGLSPLHQGFFQDAQMTMALSDGLSTCVDGPVVLAVRYDTPTRIGVLELQVERSQLRCSPVFGEGTVDLSAWSPLGASLATYREAVAGRYDLRLSSFRTRLRVARQSDACMFELTGQFPPDGSTWSSCVAFEGLPERCQVDRAIGVTLLETPTDAMRAPLAACLGR